MSATIALVFALLALWATPVSDPERDVATLERMKQREVYLQEQMTRLLQEIEQSNSMKETTLSSAVMEFLLYILVGSLVLFLPVWYLTRKSNLVCDCCMEQKSTNSEEDDEEEHEDGDEEQDKEDEHHEEADDDEEEELNGFKAASTPSPMQGLHDSCKMLRKLVDDLLSICRVLWKNSLLQMYPVHELNGLGEKWSVQENSIIYRLVVYLRPPPGYSFIVEQDSTGQLPARPPRVRVLLDCICSRGQLLGESLCLLHQPNKQPPSNQNSLFLRTLCTDSCLDMEKVTCQVQQAVRSAWMLLPESQHCQLTVLPSSRSCRFQLTGSSAMTLFAEILFAVDPSS